MTLRARDSSPEMLHSLNLMVDELARQVKRHRDKRRHRREARAAAAERRDRPPRRRARWRCRVDSQPTMLSARVGGRCVAGARMFTGLS